MDFSACRDQLANNGEAIAALVAGVTQEQSQIRPSPQEWSILEVINHLYDEEREDFRQRLDILLHHPGKAWPPINPQGWSTERGYNQRNLTTSLHHFLEERQKSLVWLDELAAPDLQRSEPHPAGGVFHAGDMLAAWVAHDLLHLRQLVELRWFLMNGMVRPYSPDYAGDW